MKKIILASNSPRRKEILTKANIDFITIKSNYEEVSPKFYSEDSIKKNSLNKALDVARQIDYAATVIGADTMVILEEGRCSVCLLKPENKSQAFLMLKNLSGKSHKVVTSISLVKTPLEPKVSEIKSLTEIEETFVTFRTLNDNEIDKYIEIFNPLDKAGSYGVQDFLAFNKEGLYTSSDNFKNLMPKIESFISKIEGDYYNVMGISAKLLQNMLNKF